MSRNRIELPAGREKVFEILIDPHAFPKWVVGAKRIRGVDPDWPRPGSAFHHASGAGGEVTVKDKTELVTMNPPLSLVLQAYLRPLGIVRIRIELDPGPSGNTTRMTIREAPAPGTRLTKVKKLLDPMLYLRNRKSLKCLEKLVRETATDAESASKGG
jgi:uncharacterized protein YndB with AHSA1/START domain